MARSMNQEISNEARWELPSGFGPEDGDAARPVPMLLLALLVVVSINDIRRVVGG